METMSVDLDDCCLSVNGDGLVCCSIDAVCEIEYDERGAYFSQVRQLKVTFKSRNDRKDAEVTIEVDDLPEAVAGAINAVVEDPFNEMLRDGGDGK